MSAIVGIYFPEGRPVDRTDLERMVETVAHRGPDRAQVWSEDSVGLGHRMLWTTPESVQEKLPLINQTGDLVLTADARIDNREELIAALRLPDRPREQIADSQLILAAYEKWGERCPEKLLGDFAFAIWDGRRQVLFCARDHFGVKPFYYYLSGEAFFFGSEIKALLCVPQVPTRLNEVRVAEHLIDSFNDRTSTFYHDISRLWPGHSITVSRQGARLQVYYSLDPSRELRLGSTAECAERFRELFTEAVRCRLRSAVPVGLTLSGGLDSSSVACVARKLLAQNGACRLPTFSGIFDEVTQCDERPFINAVLAQGGFEPHYVHGDRLRALADLDRVLWHEEEPPYFPHMFFHWGLLGAANQQGVRVILDGHDGDGVVSHGRGYLDELAEAGRWLTLAIELRALNKIRGTSSWKSVKVHTRRYAVDPLLTRFQTSPVWRIGRALYRRVQPRSHPRPQWSANLNPDFVQRLALVERDRAWQQAQPARAQTEREAHYRTITHPIQTLTLEVLDRADAAFSMESRHPFFDKRLVEFCLALPPEQKRHQGWGRMVMRRAMAGVLPAEVQWRTKKIDFAPAFSHSSLVLERERLEQLLRDAPGVEEEYVNMNALRDTYHRLVSPELPALPREVEIGFWKALRLVLWLRYSVRITSLKCNSLSTPLHPPQALGK